MSLSPAPQSNAEQPRPKYRFDFRSIRDIVIAPNAAYDRIAAAPQWLPPFAVIVVANVIAAVLYAPAILHVIAVTPPPPGEAAPATGVAIAAASARSVTAYAVVQAVLMPLALLLLTASALTTIARLRGKTVPYVLFLALAANCMIPSVIGGLISAVLVRFHDPTSFNNFRSIAIAAPTNLAIFSTPGNEREVTFLSKFDAFDVWAYVLLAFGYVRLVPVSFTAALAIAFGLDFLFAILF